MATIKGINKQNKAFAKENDRRLVRFDMTFKDGGIMEFQGSVKPEDCDRLAELWREVYELTSK